MSSPITYIWTLFTVLWLKSCSLVSTLPRNKDFYLLVQSHPIVRKTTAQLLWEKKSVFHSLDSYSEATCVLSPGTEIQSHFSFPNLSSLFLCPSHLLKEAKSKPHSPNLQSPAYIFKIRMFSLSFHILL